MSAIRASGSAVLARNKSISAPAGTPPASMNAVNKEIIKPLSTPETLEQWKNTLGLSEVPRKTPEQFGETGKSDIRDRGAIVCAGNIKAD